MKMLTRLLPQRLRHCGFCLFRASVDLAYASLRNSGSRLRKSLMTQLLQLTQREVLEYAHHGIFYIFYTLRNPFQLETGFSTYWPQQHEKG